MGGGQRHLHFCVCLSTRRLYLNCFVEKTAIFLQKKLIQTAYFTLIWESHYADFLLHLAMPQPDTHVTTHQESSETEVKEYELAGLKLDSRTVLTSIYPTASLSDTHAVTRSLFLFPSLKILAAYQRVKDWGRTRRLPVLEQTISPCQLLSVCMWVRLYHDKWCLGANILISWIECNMPNFFKILAFLS